MIPNKPNPNPGGNSGKPPYNPGSNSGKPPYNPGGNSGKPPINQGGNNDWGDLYPDNNNNPGGSSNSGNDWSNLYPDNNNNNQGGSNSGKPSHNHGGNSGKPAYDNSNNNNNPGGSEGSGTGVDWNDDDEEDYGGKSILALNYTFWGQNRLKEGQTYSLLAFVLDAEHLLGHSIYVTWKNPKYWTVYLLNRYLEKNSVNLCWLLFLFLDCCHFRFLFRYFRFQ